MLDEVVLQLRSLGTVRTFEAWRLVALEVQVAPQVLGPHVDFAAARARVALLLQVGQSQRVQLWLPMPMVIVLHVVVPAVTGLTVACGDRSERLVLVVGDVRCGGTLRGGVFGAGCVIRGLMG